MHPWGKGRRDARRRGSDREAPAEATRRDVRLRAVSMSWWSGTRDGSSVIICSFTMAAIEGRTPLAPSLLVPCYPERRRPAATASRRLSSKKSPRLRPPSRLAYHCAILPSSRSSPIARTLPVRTIARIPWRPTTDSVVLELERPGIAPRTWERKDRCSSSASQADWHCLSWLFERVPVLWGCLTER